MFDEHLNDLAGKKIFYCDLECPNWGKTPTDYWIATNPDGEVVGFCGLCVREGRINGEMVEAAEKWRKENKEEAEEFCKRHAIVVKC
jgi:hypothetical protein